MNAPVAMTKMNGSGNRIIVADMRGRNDRITSEAARVLAATDETGFDQIMAIHDSQHDNADYTIEILNSDGSLAGACGNGTRCVTEWLCKKEKRNCFTFDTAGGIIHAQQLQNGLVSVDMGGPRCKWQDIPLASAIEDTSHVALRCGPLADASVVSMGNPHAIFFVTDNVMDYSLEDYGPKLEHDPLFPERANISIARITSGTSLELRTWERGAGLTPACGTAACASVVAACRRSLNDRQAMVTLPGGRLSISWKKNDHVLLTGPTEYEFSGLLDPASGRYTRSSA